VPLLSCIVSEQKARKVNPKRDDYQRKTKEIFIACEESRDYSNVCHFCYHAPTRVHHFNCHALCVGYPNGKANCPTFQRNIHRDVTVV
jgi:hypothetical protein